MLDAMLDLETLGTEPGCIVLTIGVVFFSHQGVHDTFEVTIDPQDSERHGLIPQASTVMWWLDQSKEAQNALTANKGVSLKAALHALEECTDWKLVGRVWCNGASFDFPILKAIHKAAGVSLPWPYYAEMDFRTFKNLFNKNDFLKHKSNPLIPHSAVADAVAQAETVINLLQSVEQGELKWAA